MVHTVCIQHVCTPSHSAQCYCVGDLLQSIVEDESIVQLNTKHILGPTC